MEDYFCNDLLSLDSLISFFQNSKIFFSFFWNTKQEDFLTWVIIVQYLLRGVHYFFFTFFYIYSTLSLFALFFTFQYCWCFTPLISYEQEKSKTNHIFQNFGRKHIFYLDSRASASCIQIYFCRIIWCPK